MPLLNVHLSEALSKGINDVVEGANELAFEDQFFGGGVQLKVIDHHFDNLIDDKLIRSRKPLHQLLDCLVDQAALLATKPLKHVEVLLHEAGETILLVQVFEFRTINCRSLFIWRHLACLHAEGNQVAQGSQRLVL